MALDDWFDPSAHRSRKVSNEIMSSAQKEAKAAAKGPSSAEVRQKADAAATQAAQVAGAGAAQAAQNLMGAGTGAVSPGRAQGLMEQSQQAAAEAGAMSNLSAREMLVAENAQKKREAIATATQIAQFNRKAAQADLDRLMDFGAGALDFFGN